LNLSPSNIFIGTQHKENVFLCMPVFENGAQAGNCICHNEKQVTKPFAHYGTTTGLRFIASRSGCLPWAFRKLVVCFYRFNSYSL